MMSIIVSTYIKYIASTHVFLIKIRLSRFAVPLLPEGHLHIDQWVLFGGSWGSALALAYGEAHPTKVNGFILRGLFLGREQETKQIWRGMRNIFPDAWQEMVNFVPKEEQAELEESFYKRILNPNRHITLPAARAFMKY